MLSRSFLTLTKPRTLLLASSALALAYIAPSFTTTIGSSASRNMSRLPDSAFPVQKTEEEWRLQLSPEQFRVRLSLPFQRHLFVGSLTSFLHTGHQGAGY